MNMTLEIMDYDGVVTYRFWGRGVAIEKSWKTNLVSHAVKSAKNLAKILNITVTQIIYIEPLISDKEHKLYIKGLNK